MAAFDIVTIRLFLAIARAGSIGEAARREHIAASAVSRRISDLEAALKVQLLRRVPHGVELTAEGRMMAAHGERLLSVIQDMTRDFRPYAEGERGEVYLAAVTSALNTGVPEALRTFREAHPEVTVHVQELYSREAVEAVTEGRVDFAVVADTAHRGSRLHAVPFCEDPIWVVTPLDHPLLAGRKPGEGVSIAEAAGYDVISLHQGGAIDELISAGCREAGVTLSSVIHVSRFGSLRRMVEAGLGIGFLRHSSIERYLEVMAIQAAPISDAWAARSLDIISTGRDHMPPAARRLHDFLADQGRGA
ncbi:LysR family transcriptional regulator [Caenispirillum bisanense]|uniref:DNA-binding transcriptional regulator, LysR family n=1 Tax=Caenispirillum bisanense TaxID=414052 RepID=A0A286GN40_9PROT|nr:LysR family transcriptional regulator [Caenispirillum bisanense]SOD96971.1 DNA-binding transcriptional regulator, LysR family [Caenispirillum bisanense]